jgi:cardiolipin synthase
MTFANGLTVLRIVLIPFFISALIYRRLGLALFLFLLAVITDFLDGFVARRTQVTTLGTFIDPVADKLLLVSAYIMLPILDAVPVWVSVIVVSRDVIIALGYGIIYQTWGSTQLGVRPLGKLTTFLQSFGAAFVILGKLTETLQPAAWYFACGVAVITAISGVDYILTATRHINLLSEQKKA